MPTLVILRHAEAVPSRSDDHARPLTPQGRADAASAGANILSRLAGPLLVLASDAQRTRETAELAFAAEPDADIHPVAALYSATTETLLAAVREVSATVDVMVLVGHNPGVSTFAETLFADGEAADRARIAAGMPTASAAIYHFEEPWAKVGKHTGRLIATLVPDGKVWSA